MRRKLLSRASLVHWLLAALMLATVAACSPEASRTRGGGSGGDIGNRATDVQLHPAGPKIIYYNTPKEGAASELAGMPVE
ncbi:MAG: hypothetical protein NZL87_05535 [Thermomicrobium sp.]|nr:hypothetical protein [Thermomicrobium sp.]MCX7623319.1 hypothetical protein [Thermomicrobium sp.]